MKKISNKTRVAISSIVSQLFDVAKAIEPANPTLAAIYRSIAEGIDGSDYKFQGGYRLHFKFPKGCELNLSGPGLCMIEGPASFSVKLK